MRVLREPFRFGTGFFQADHGRIGGFLRSDIFARALAQFFGRLRDVENVVDDLKGETERMAEFGEGGQLGRAGVGAHGAEPNAGAEEGSGFVFVNVSQLRACDRLAFGFEIGDLAGDESAAAGAGGDLLEDSAQRVAARGLGAGGNLEGDGEERVARKNGDSFPEGLVASGAAAAEIVIIHARQIVVHERVGMNAFDGAGERQSGFGLATTGLRGGEAEDGTEALAAGEEAVAHRLMNGGGADGGGGQEALERALHCGAPGAEVFGQGHRSELWKFRLRLAMEKRESVAASFICSPASESSRKN